MSTTLPLFWHLSSASPEERLDASVKLVGALEQFQAQFVPKPKEASSESSDEEEDGQDEESTNDRLNALNAQDVAYSIRRLIRGLASPRESSRLGFAVALTELLSRLDTISSSQITLVVIDSSKTAGSMTGQEERDMLFARLFGLTSVIQSGLLFRNAPLPSSSILASDPKSFQDVLSHLIEVGEKKSWLKESAWSAVGLALDGLAASDVAWKDEAVDSTLTTIYGDKVIWSPEKVAATLKLQSLYPKRSWGKLLQPTFKHAELLSTGNLSTLARIMKESYGEEDDETAKVTKSGTGFWKPQVHFVWDSLLDHVLSSTSKQRASLQEFFRIVVDESLFATNSSTERKYWGFQIFQKALPRVGPTDLPMLFTKNFMRCWINHLSNHDRYLHKIARQVATETHEVVQKNPKIGFTLVLQLTGAHGDRQFDRLTRTKTVESILTSMDLDGIENYIDHLLSQISGDKSTEQTDFQALNARRLWIIEQLAALIRNGAVPKGDGWVQSVLDWLAVHGLFVVVKKTEKSPYRALHSVVKPPLSDELRKNCRVRLLACLGELTGHTTVTKGDNKTTKSSAVASDGRFWVSKVLDTIDHLEKDTKHVSSLREADEDDLALRQKARDTIERIQKVAPENKTAASGAELLVAATLLHHYCANDDDDGNDADSLEACLDGASRMFPAEAKKPKKSRKSTGEQVPVAEDVPPPIDVLVDTIIGFLEASTQYMRTVANQVFSMLSGTVQASTLDLILTQLERRDPTAEAEESDGDSIDADDVGEEQPEDSSSGSEDEEHDDDDAADDGEVDLELRRKIEEALRVNGVDAAADSDDESEELMDDDQMMAIDEQLADIFRSRAQDSKKGSGAQREATHFKNRVLDLVDIYLRTQASSPLSLRCILPLLDLITGTGTDEKQLADKATGILRSRIGKAKDLPTPVDVELVTELLKEIHLRAKKARSPDVLTTLSQCSLHVAKVLIHSDREEAVVEAYRASLQDFVTRKASPLNHSFFQDFIRRQPATAWNLREEILTVAGKAVNTYRQCQALQLLQTLVGQLAAMGDRDQEFISFVPALRDSLLEVTLKACTETTLTAPQLRELLRFTLSAIRQTKRIVPTLTELPTLWRRPSWESLATDLSESQRFKASTALQTVAKQVVQLLGAAPTPAPGKADGVKVVGDQPKPKKRKASEGKSDPADVLPAEKSERKKAKKV